MPGRLTQKRVRALLTVAGRGADEIGADIEDELDEEFGPPSEVAVRIAREKDELLADYREARAILWQRYLSPKPEPREPDEVLPGFD